MSEQTVIHEAAAPVWQGPVFEAAARRIARDLVRHAWARVTLASAVVLVPCFWQQRIEAGDLRSHVYNAWLVQLIERGQAPGLWIAHIRSNVLFDYLLSALAKIFSLSDAARIAVSFAVLIFFWGTFAFVRAITGRSAWHLMPVLLAITYGWTFQEGLLNYYLSLGLAFVGLALFLRRNTWRWVSIAVLAPLAFLAHPLGAGWLLAASVYLALAEAIPPRLNLLFVCSAIATVFGLRVLLQSHYQVEDAPSSALYNIVFYNGADQLILTGRYVLPAVMVAIPFVVTLVGELKRRKGVRGFLGEPSVVLQLYLIMQTAVLLLPNSTHLNQYAAPISAMTTRLTSIPAVLMCALLGTISTRRWHIPVLVCSTALFFGFLYQDTAVLNRMEDQVTRLVHAVPEGHRVIATIGGPPRYRLSTKHMVDFSCIGHCFSYGNYEAPSEQFRVRASPGNAYVVSAIHDATLMEEGRYLVQAADLPLYQVYQCSSDWTVLCIRSLKVGEMNDHYGVHPGREPVQAKEITEQFR